MSEVPSPHEQLRGLLESASPKHDSELGMLHPYWARKPLNIVSTIVETLSNRGDTVLDPFMGSGTTVFASLQLGRRAVGSDLNPLASLVTGGTLDLAFDRDSKRAALRAFVSDLASGVREWFHYSDEWYVERERYTVKGTYEHGRFELRAAEVVLKESRNGSLRGRRVERPSSEWVGKLPPKEFHNCPVDFSKIELMPNSRIAVPRGAVAKHYFTLRNLSAINLALGLIAGGKYGEENERVLRLFLSACIPLLRLSDKKASSQWPFWRPRDSLTSRNPAVVAESKLVAFERAIDWLAKEGISHPNYYELYTAPFQQLKFDGEVDLVVTDPPYADHAPYLEYSALFNAIVGLELVPGSHGYEIVKSDAHERAGDTRDYTSRLRDALAACAQFVRTGGYVAWFYQDQYFEHWAAIEQAALVSGLEPVQVLALPKQRKSLKGVTSPGRTLSGDLVLVFQKSMKLENKKEEQPFETRLSALIQEIAKMPVNASFFDKYAKLVEVGLLSGLMRELSKKYTRVTEIIDSAYQVGGEG